MCCVEFISFLLFQCFTCIFSIKFFFIQFLHSEYTRLFDLFTKPEWVKTGKIIKMVDPITMLNLMETTPQMAIFIMNNAKQLKTLNFESSYPIADSTEIRRAISLCTNVRKILRNNSFDEDLLQKLKMASKLIELSINTESFSKYNPTTLPITTLEISASFDFAEEDPIFDILRCTPNINILSIQDGNISLNSAAVITGLKLSTLCLTNVNVNIFEISQCIAAINTQFHLETMKFIFTEQWEKHMPALSMSLNVVEHLETFHPNVKELTFTDNYGDINITNLSRIEKLKKINVYICARSVRNTIKQFIELKKPKIIGDQFKGDVKINFIEFVEEDRITNTDELLRNYKTYSDQMMQELTNAGIEFVPYKYEFFD